MSGNFAAMERCFSTESITLPQVFDKLPRCIVGMEACLSAHFFSRTPRRLGFEPRIIPAIYVKPFSEGQKNDYNDAEAIAEAALRPNLKTVAEKSQDQLDLQALHRVRSRLVSRRTATINQIRASLLPGDRAGVTYRSKGMNFASQPATVAASIGYLLMGGVFVFAGVDHARRFVQVRGMLARRGWPAPGALLVAGSLLEFAAGLGLAFGIARAVSALALAAFTVVASFLLLDFWRFTGPEREGMRSGFLVNIGLVGGLILAFAVRP